MQELLKTLITNPYSFIVLIALGLAPIGLIISIIALKCKKPNYNIFKTSITLVAIALISPLFLNNISQIKQEEAVNNINAHVTKKGDKLIIHSESKWLNDGSFDIVRENDTHYYIKNEDEIFELKKTDVKGN